MKNNKKKSETNHHSCKFCNSSNVSSIIDFGSFALAGAFLKPEQFPDEKKYRLQLFFCENCYLLQIRDIVPPEILFRRYFYYSSAIGTLRDHFKSYATEVSQRFIKHSSNATIVEIGCNDGVLLNPLAEIGIKNIIGVDPSTNPVKKISHPAITVFNTFFTNNTAREVFDQFGPADLILANNVYAHIENIHDATMGISNLLSKDGVFIFEVHYLENLIEEVQYDMIYHEHLYYYSLLALENFFRQFDMEIFDVKEIPIHAGSMRYYVRKKGGFKKETISSKVHKLRQMELSKKYDKVETFLDYAKKVEKTKRDLLGLLNHLKKEKGKKISGYGASGRANTIIQYCGISHDIQDYMIDDAPAKHGFYTPGSHYIIKSKEIIEDNPPDYILVYAWSFIKEIINKNMGYIKNGGKLIVPLPEVKIISSKNVQDILKVEKHG